MQVLFPAAFIAQQVVPIPVHWFLARKSCIFNETSLTEWSLQSFKLYHYGEVAPRPYNFLVVVCVRYSVNQATSTMTPCLLFHPS